MHRVRLSRTLLVAGVCQLILLGGNALATLLTDKTGALAWMVTPLISVVVAMLQALAEAYSPGEAGPARPRGRTPLPIVLVVVLLVVGVGGYFVTVGVRTAVGYVTGNEPGKEHLWKRTSGTSRGLTLRIISVQRTDHFTRVEVESRNRTGNTVALPLYRNCTFTSEQGTTLEADAFKSDWSEQLAPGSLQRGTITFNGHLPRSERTASLTFATVFGMGFDGPETITVSGIRLTKNPRTVSPTALLVPGAVQRTAARGT